MVQCINGWTFFDVSRDELNEGYPKRTLAINSTKEHGAFKILSYDFPKSSDIHVEMNGMDMSGSLSSLDEAFEFIKYFKEKGEDAFSNNLEMNFGGNSDMQIMLDVNQAGDITRNGKMIDFQSELTRMRRGW